MNSLLKMLIMFCVTSFAYATGADIPDALLYQGKPIDSLCFFETGEESGVVDLARCGLHAETGRKISGRNDKLLDQGYIGYDYAWKIDQSSPTTQGYSYYKPFGVMGDEAIVATLNNSGGTGQFSSISVIKRLQNSVKVTVYNSGDRCNNGIVEVWRESNDSGDKLVYSVNLTAYDFLTLTKDNPRQLQPYDDLESCAACCKATAIFERPINDDFADETLQFVDLSVYPVREEQAHADNSRSYQDCFDDLLQTYKQTHQSKLNFKALKEFTHQFNAECVKSRDVKN